MLNVTPQFISDIEQDRRVLGTKYLPRLPPDMRAVVAQAMVSEHLIAIERICEPQPPEAA